MLFILGILDVLVAIILLVSYLVIFDKLLIVAAFYLIIKGALFWKSWASWIDIIIGLFIFTLVFFNWHIFWILFIAALYLLQKGVITLFSSGY